jgi:tRNA G37 N-methylase Trm5
LVHMAPAATRQAPIEPICSVLPLDWRQVGTIANTFRVPTFEVIAGDSSLEV